MRETKRTWFAKGMKDGIPIALGYFAVAFTLGIAAKNAGFTPFQSFLISFTNNASAGEFAGITLVAAGAGYLEVAIMELITNARYLLMSCALSQKLSPETSMIHRLLISYDVTDELFGICISVPGKLSPYYAFGAYLMALPGWSLGSAMGTLMGSVLPANVVSALSVGLYGMFLAVIIPPARKSKILAGVVLISMIASFGFTKLPWISGLSAGTRTILLTLLIAGGTAVLFPVEDEETMREQESDEERKGAGNEL
ncbi:branched-chain amino acid ABC transporter permease [Ruminococcus sp. AF14-10]|nr:branched-chain amino acid ABC transporter permease [Ruminococcus sp. AF14-10]